MTAITGMRLAGSAGIVFVVGALAGGFMAPIPPSLADPASEFLDYYADHRSLLLVQSVVNMLVFIPGGIFTAGLWRLLRASEGEVLGLAATLSLVAAGAIASVCGAGFGALGWLGDGHGLDEDAAKQLTVLLAVANQSIFAATATVTLASGALILANALLPRWVGWVGIAAGLLSLIAVGSFADDGVFAPFGPMVFAGFLSFMAYVLVLAMFMLRQRE